MREGKYQEGAKWMHKLQTGCGEALQMLSTVKWNLLCAQQSMIIEAIHLEQSATRALEYRSSREIAKSIFCIKKLVLRFIFSSPLKMQLTEPPF